MKYLIAYLTSFGALYWVFLFFLNASIGPNNFIGNLIALFLFNLTIFFSVKFWFRMKEEYV